MFSFRQIIDRWPSLGDLAQDAGVAYGTAKQWRLRNSIPARYWPWVVNAAAHRGIQGVTLETLSRIAAASTRSGVSEPTPNEATTPYHATPQTAETAEVADGWVRAECD